MLRYTALILKFLSLSCISILVFYLIGGIMYMKIRNYEIGLKNMPNYNFWIEIPGNIKVKLNNKKQRLLKKIYFVTRLVLNFQFLKYEDGMIIHNYKKIIIVRNTL